jgi:hypothetical protein
MTVREEEEAALDKEELNDLNGHLAAFERGECGIYGSRDHPGLLARLSAVQKYWETIRQMGAKVKATTGWVVTFEVPARQLESLSRWLKNEIDNESLDLERMLRGEGFSLEDLQNFQTWKALFKDLYKAIEEGKRQSSLERTRRVLESMPKKE